MAITTRDQLVNALGQRIVLPFFKDPASLTVGGSGVRLDSMRAASGQPAAAAATPTTAVTCDASTSGALGVPTAATGKAWYLASFAAYADTSTPAVVVLFDRYAHAGGLSGTVTTAQTVNLGLPTRATDPTLAGIYLEVATSMTASGNPSVTASYTNQDSVSGRTATLTGGLSGFTAQYLHGPFDLQSGDSGVRSVESVTLGAAAGSAGNIIIALARQVVRVLIPGSTQGEQVPYAQSGLPSLGDSPCLMFATIGGGAFYGTIGLSQA